MTKLLAFTGQKGSGKDTASTLLSGNYVDVKFAAPWKNMLRVLLQYRGADSVTIERMIEGDLKEEPTEYLNGKSPRYALQTLGTGWGREMIHQDIWIDAFRDRASKFKNVVCTDCRFPNEVQRIHEMGGKVARINRETDNDDYHVSERHIDALEVDFDIQNDGTIEYLELQVQEFEGN